MSRAPSRRVPRRRLAAFAAGGLATAALAAFGGAGAASATGTSATKARAAADGLPYEDASLPVSQRVADLLSRMTLAEKLGQMTQAERANITADGAQVTELGLGSVLSGGGSVPTPNTPQAWADMVDAYQRAALATRLHIPILYGIDAVHGNGNALGATVFPHNIGLGATRNPALVRKVEHITAEETRASGPNWAFAPCLCAARDDRWGRTYESFSEDPDLVIKMETAIDGFQGKRASQLADPDRVLASAKHFAGDGDTEYGTGSGTYKIDQGIAVTNHADFWENALRQYEPAVRKHHVGTVMPSYSSVDWTEDGVGNPVKMHANGELINGVLKNQLGFDGFVISDYNAIDQLPGTTLAEHARAAVNAGVDMFMQPSNYREFIAAMTDEVTAGRVPMARIDDAVSRILTKKFQMGLFEHPLTNRTHIGDIGSAAHRKVARKAVQQSQVLLKNKKQTLPLATGGNVYVAGSNADSIGNQAGGWTLTWQGSPRNVIPGTTILGGIRQAVKGGSVTYSADASKTVHKTDLGIVVVGETPYAEGYGDVGAPGWPYEAGEGGVARPSQTMQLSDADKAAVDKVCAKAAKCAVVVVSGRPLIIDPAQLRQIDALLAAWLPGSEGEGVADTLFGKVPFTGKLPMTWPRTLAQEPINVGDANYDPLYPFGYGLQTKAG
jgi:beta-glucosidase